MLRGEKGMALDNSCWAAGQYLRYISTEDIIAELKSRYKGELAILDYLEMIECELGALKREEKK